MTHEQTIDAQALLAIDHKYILHPYSSLKKPLDNLLVTKAAGVRLTLADGTELIDGMASWWSVIHGYNHPELNAALNQQLEQMAHVMFGGITHPPAIQLAQTLVEMTPVGLEKVFFADSGSVAIEVAIKMALQYHYSQGQGHKNKLLTIRNGYHGDTFMAMSVCDPINGMHHLWGQNLIAQYFADAPQSPDDAHWQAQDLDSLDKQLQQHDDIAAIILEPIVQGAGGMRFYAPEYLRQVRARCDEYGILLIADEIATGFGRTGRLFACEHAGISPDILCIGKAITGGYLSFAATLCNEKVSDGIAEGIHPVLMHGPTFMGNPLACAVANKSIELLLHSPWQQRVVEIERQLKRYLLPLAQLSSVANARVLGAIGVIELHQPVDLEKIQPALIKLGIWLRPFGKLLYLMPAYSISPAELKQLLEAISQLLEDIAAYQN